MKLCTKCITVPFRLITLLFFILISSTALWKIPQLQTDSAQLSPKDRVELENAARATLAQILGGAIVFMGAYFTWRTVTATEDQQVTERFGRAIEHLGSNQLEIRLGGIYALERISKDSPKDYWTVMDILTAYVRENFPATEEQLQTKPATDLQAILTVISRRKWLKEDRSQPIDKRHYHDLSDADLRGLILGSSNLENVLLSGANLAGSYLSEASLKGVSMVNTNLRGVQMSKTCLEGATLAFANLKGANLSHANLRNANLQGANFKGAYLDKANFLGANLEGAVELTKEQLNQAVLNHRTKLPSYLKS